MDKTVELKHLLVKTVQNHHQYQESQLDGKYNLLWSDWYANYLLENGLVALWGKQITQEDLAKLLVELDKDYNAKERDGHWPGYYAEKMMAMLTNK